MLQCSSIDPVPKPSKGIEREQWLSRNVPGLREVPATVWNINTEIVSLHTHVNCHPHTVLYIRDFPDDVGVATTTLLPSSRCEIAADWCKYNWLLLASASAAFTCLDKLQLPYAAGEPFER